MQKGNKTIKYIIIRDVRILSQQKVEDYCKPVRAGNFWSNNYIKYESNGDRNKTLSVYQLKNIFIKLDHTEKIS